MKVINKIVIHYEDATFVFRTLSLQDVLNLGINPEQNLQAVYEQFGNFLVSWENVVDENGVPIPCSADNFVKKLPVNVALEVFKRFCDLSGLSKEFEKNSEGLSEPQKS